MKFYIKALDVFYMILMSIVSLSLFLMIFVAFLEVCRRYVLGLSYMWADELIRYLIICVGFLGGAAAFRSKSLVSLDLVTQFLPKKIQLILEIVCNTVILASLLFLTKYSIQTLFMPSIRRQISIGLKVSMSYPYVSLPLGFIFMIIFALDNYREFYVRWKELGAR